MGLKLKVVQNKTHPLMFFCRDHMSEPKDKKGRVVVIELCWPDWLTVEAMLPLRQFILCLICSVIKSICPYFIIISLYNLTVKVSWFIQHFYNNIDLHCRTWNDCKWRLTYFNPSKWTATFLYFTWEASAPLVALKWRNKRGTIFLLDNRLSICKHTYVLWYVCGV